MGTGAQQKRRGTQPPALKEGLLRIEDASTYLGLSKNTLYRLTADKKIEHSKPNGKVIMFTREQLDKYASKNLQMVAA